MKKTIWVMVFLLLVGTVVYANDINLKDKNGDTQLHHAIKSGDFQYVMMLLSNGADPFLENHAGVSPFDMVFQKSTPSTFTVKTKPIFPNVFAYGQTDLDKRFEELKFKIEVLEYENEVLENELHAQKNQTIFIAMLLFGMINKLQQ